MWVQSLGCEDPLQKEMATHSSIALKIPWSEELSMVGCSPWDRKKLDVTEHVLTASRKKYNLRARVRFQDLTPITFDTLKVIFTNSTIHRMATPTVTLSL